jgi:D-glycero-alpha-D-manno-heptose-7-phosphate kinase
VIISRTPFRVSLVGGGSDIRQYYRTRPGTVIATAIKRYMYVTVNKRFDDSLRVSYTKTEIVARAKDLQHDLIREALAIVGIQGGVEITTIADLPAGIGLASSSTVTVGVLNALHAFLGRHVSADQLAREACEVEIERLKRPIGKQDQYIAAYGGFQRIRFNSNETVEVNPIICSEKTSRHLSSRLMLFYTGIQRSASAILAETTRRLGSDAALRGTLDQMVSLAEELRSHLLRQDATQVGTLLARAWELKKQTGSTVSNGTLDAYYTRARRAGAEGGKVLGAGGGGCLLLHVPRTHQTAVRRSMLRAGLKEVPFGLEPEGSKIIYVGG